MVLHTYKAMVRSARSETFRNEKRRKRGTVVVRIVVSVVEW